MAEVDQSNIGTIGSQVVLQTQQGEASGSQAEIMNQIFFKRAYLGLFVQEISGVVYGSAFDGPKQVIVLQQPGSTPFHTNIRIIKQNNIDRIVSETPPPAGEPLEGLPPVDERRCRDREEKAVRVAELEAAKIGVNVTEEGQAVFDSLAKTLPCRWQDKTIVVLDEVFISEPYTPESCKSLHKDDTATLDRVVKILLAEKAKVGAG